MNSENYKKDLAKALSDKEVLKIAGPNSRVFLYPQIANMKSIDELVNDTYPNAIILYQSEDDPQTNSIYGHWTALKKISRNKICYFDSYGNMIDYPLTRLDAEYRIKTRQLFKKLSHLLGGSNYTDINYNEHDYQGKNKDIATCGRWASYFCSLGLDTDGFHQVMSTAKKLLGYKDYDKLIVDLTNKLL